MCVYLYLSLRAHLSVCLSVCLSAQLGGPVWSDPIHDRDFVQGLLEDVSSCPVEMYKTKDRIKGLLTVVSEVR